MTILYYKIGPAVSEILDYDKLGNKEYIFDLGVCSSYKVYVPFFKIVSGTAIGFIVKKSPYMFMQYQDYLVQDILKNYVSKMFFYHVNKELC